MFDALVPLLAHHHTLIGVDSPGHGRSPRGEEPLRIASMARDLARTLAALDLTDAPILGYSDGGNLALELAVRHGQRGPLILVGANLTPDGLRPSTRAALAVEHALLAPAAALLPGLRARAERLALMVTDPQLDAADLTRITARVLVITGEHDVIDPGHTALIVRSLSHAHAVVIPGVGHALPTQAPTSLAAEVLAFGADVAG